MLTHGLFDSSCIPVMEQVISFTRARHNVLAGNVANMDTPGYHTRDLSEEKFNLQLKAAIDSHDTRNRPISANHPAIDLEGVRRDFTDLLHHDESNVSIEQQVAALSKNQIRHNTAMTIMVSQMHLLQAAISERA